MKGENIEVEGWALDPSATENTGIKKLHIFLNGPMDTGLDLGDGGYGTIQRSDVADVFGPQFTNCGFSLGLDASQLRPNEKHYLYIYAQRPDDSWEKRISQFYIYESDYHSNLFLEIDNYISEFTVNAEETVNIRGASFYVNDPQSFYGSPDYASKQVVFVSDRAGGGHFDLYISNLDGSNLRKLTDNNVDDLYPNVSPDGKQIAFTSEVGGLWQVFIINADGTDLRQITTSNTLNAYPDWSHDGQYLFYESRVGDVWEVYRIGVDGSNPTRLTNSPEAHDWHPATHPFRPLVLFESGTKEDIKIMDYNGENVHYITRDDQRNRVPYFARDGRTIVYSRYLGASGEVFIMDINGEVLAQITADGGTNTHPIFSPDDKYIGYDSNVSGKEQVYIYSFEEDSVFNVINDLDNNYKDPCFIFE
ncbi:MAG: TolB family protein [Actinomycetota bacterium]